MLTTWLIFSKANLFLTSAQVLMKTPCSRSACFSGDVALVTMPCSTFASFCGSFGKIFLARSMAFLFCWRWVDCFSRSIWCSFYWCRYRIIIKLGPFGISVLFVFSSNLRLFCAVKFALQRFLLSHHACLCFSSPALVCIFFTDLLSSFFFSWYFLSLMRPNSSHRFVSSGVWGDTFAFLLSTFLYLCAS